MLRQLIFFPLFVCSSLVFAQRLEWSSIPVESIAFTVFADVNVVDPSESLEIDNMPRYQSQGTFAICFACAAAAVAQKFACDTDKKIIKSGIRCADLPDTSTISPLGMVSWSDTNLGLANYDKNRQIAGDPSNHSNLKLHADRSDYSNAVNALMNSADLFEFIPQSCKRLPALLAKYSESGPLFSEAYENLRPIYLKNRTTELRADVACLHCRDVLSKILAINFTDDEIQQALNTPTFGQFLHSLIFNRCEPISFRPKPIFRSFPARNETAARESVLRKIKELVFQKKIILIKSICLAISNGKCRSEHSVAVSGFRKVCPDSRFDSSKCRYQIKLHNCWGPGWQEKSNGGWVDSKLFIDHMNFGENVITGGQLSWLEKR